MNLRGRISGCARDPSTAVPSFAKKHPCPENHSPAASRVDQPLPSPPFLTVPPSPRHLFPHPYFKGCSRFLSSPIASYLRPRRVACGGCLAGRHGVG